MKTEFRIVKKYTTDKYCNICQSLQYFICKCINYVLFHYKYFCIVKVVFCINKTPPCRIFSGNGEFSQNRHKFFSCLFFLCSFSDMHVALAYYCLKFFALGFIVRSFRKIQSDIFLYSGYIFTDINELSLFYSIYAHLHKTIPEYMNFPEFCVFK